MPPADLSGAADRLGPVQMRRRDGFVVTDAESVKRSAASGIAGTGGSLPHLDRIQTSFGPDHDLSAVRAHVGGEAAAANQAMGAEGFATGNHIAFAEQPDLRLAAHEAAHVVQQRQGVSLSRGVGTAGDAHEQTADAVADRVVRGESARDLLPQPGAGAAGDLAVQRYVEGDVAGNRGGRISESGETAIDLASNALYATEGKIREANALLKGVGQRGSYISLVPGRVRFYQGEHQLIQVIPEVKPLGDHPSNDKLRDANQPDGVDSEGQTGDHHTGYKAALWSDCGRTAATIGGVDSNDQDRGDARAQYNVGDEEAALGKSNNPAWMSDQIYFTAMPKFLEDPRNVEHLKEGHHYIGHPNSIKRPSNAFEARAQYLAFDKEGRRAFDKFARINTAASPGVGGAYVMNTERTMPGFAPGVTRRGREIEPWGYHWAGVIMKDGSNDIALESYAVGRSGVMTSEDQYNWINRDWMFQMYGTESEGQSFHEQHLASGTHGNRASSFATKFEE